MQLSKQGSTMHTACCGFRGGNYHATAEIHLWSPCVFDPPPTSLAARAKHGSGAAGAQLPIFGSARGYIHTQATPR